MKMSATQLKKGGSPLTKRGMLTPEQCRAARAVLGWSREDLAQKAGVSAGTVVGFELLGADSEGFYTAEAAANSRGGRDRVSSTKVSRPLMAVLACG